MKRQGQLIEKIADIENLYLANYKAQKGKIAKMEVYEYCNHLQSNLQTLRYQILTGHTVTGEYRYFTIYDPKKRLICAAPYAQRVLHHALLNICHPYFEKRQIFDSYASRPGKGTYAALDKARQYTYKYKWYLKLDFRKYFDNIDHLILKRQLCKLFKDEQLLLIFFKIIDSYCSMEDKGVPIGNLTSQYFANHYLTPADHYAKEVLKIPAYVRYMDDMVLWHNDKDKLLEAGYLFQKFAEGELKLSLKPFCLNERTKGLPFLGYILFPENVLLTQRSKKRFIQKSEIYEANLGNEVWSQKEYQNHVTPLIAFTEYANSREFRKTLYHWLLAYEELTG